MEDIRRDDNIETVNKLKKKINTGDEQKESSRIDNILERQIRAFRVVFGSITSGIAIDIAFKIRSLDPIDASSLIGTGIVWIILCGWFIITYKIEHWDNDRKSVTANKTKAEQSITDNKTKTNENRIEMLSEMRKYVLQDWLPNARTDDEKIKILNALGKLMSFANVDDMKGDFAAINKSIADMFDMFLGQFKNVKSDIFTSMDKIMKRNNPAPIDDDLLPDGAKSGDGFTKEDLDKALEKSSFPGSRFNIER